MSKIRDAFSKGKAFIGFIAAGDPNIEKTADFIKVMEESGADLIELGIPFSDPAADGPIIQQASIRALETGVTPDKIFTMLNDIKDKISIPIVLLTYLNPVYNYGYESFFAKCALVGVEGVIIPDLPYEERHEVLEFSEKHGVALIQFIAPTSCNRIKMIAEKAEGFIYCVSSLGVTGVKKEIVTDLKTITSKIREVTDIPIAVGFGIATPEQAAMVADCADGVIVGSAIVKIIGEHGEKSDDYIAKYVREMKEAIS